jgi:UDP-glucuronate 4-epimerase
LASTILVTGCAGFIGSHLAQALLARGDTVVGLDNFNEYYDPERKRANLAEVARSAPQSDRFLFVNADIRDAARAEHLFQEHDIRKVAHLAAMAGVRASIHDPQLYFDVNLTGTLTLLDAARSHRIENFVLGSTSSVYGDTRIIPFVETDPCDRPLAPYATSKRAAEMLGYTYHHLHRLNFTALRFFTVYGPRNRPDMMAYKVADNIVFGREVPIFNNGQMRRDWTYVDDIVRGVLAALDRPLGYEIVNLGRGQPVLLSDFVQLVEALAGRKANLVPAPMPDTDIPATCADITKAARLLGYQPQISVEDGVARFWHWYEQAVLARAGSVRKAD